jgi:hypothetical protein
VTDPRRLVGVQGAQYDPPPDRPLRRPRVLPRRGHRRRRKAREDTGYVRYVGDRLHALLDDTVLDCPTEGDHRGLRSRPSAISAAANAAARTALQSSAKPRSTAPGLARKRYAPTGRSASDARTAARSRRFSLFRSTARPCPRPIAYPTTGMAVASGPSLLNTTDTAPLCARPSGRDSARNVARLRILPTMGATVILARAGAGSHRQPMTPFEPSRLQDRPAGTRRHALAEPVPLRSLARVGLISSLHVRKPFRVARRRGPTGPAPAHGPPFRPSWAAMLPPDGRRPRQATLVASSADLEGAAAP